jgi:hypothetical protein
MARVIDERQMPASGRLLTVADLAADGVFPEFQVPVAELFNS